MMFEPPFVPADSFETHFAASDNFTGPKTFRWEAHVSNEDVSPPFRGAGKRRDG